MILLGLCRSIRLLLAIVLALSHVRCSLCDGSIPPLWDFRPRNDVTSFLLLSKDLQLMDEVLLDETEEAFTKALKIYDLGAYADPYVELTVNLGLAFDIPDGGTLTGQDESGEAVKVYAAFSSYKAKDTVLKVVFRSNDKNAKKCVRAGLPEPDISGCLVLEGELVMEGKSKPIKYRYTLDDIKTFHQISNFSILAHGKMRMGGSANSEYFQDFQKQVNFFGVPNYGDLIVHAAANQGTFQGKKTDFFLDFSIFNPRGRRSVMIHTMSFMIVGQFILRELDIAMTHCEHFCEKTDTDCNHISLRSLDNAVALYTGSVFTETGKGNFFFGLADNMCKAFKTCGPNNTSTEGHAKVNYDVFQGFKEVQTFLDEANCVGAKKSKETLVREMSVPLIQAALMAIYMDVQKDTVESRAERIIFSAAVAPLFNRCDPRLSLDVFDALEQVDSEDFQVVKSVYEEHYRCLAVTCEEVGGIWDPQLGNYKEGADSCYHPPPVEVKEESHLAIHIIIFIALGGLVVGGLAYYITRQLIYRRKRLRDFEDDDDVDSIGGLSADSGNSIT